jgi:hypothetical protein
VEKKDTRPDAMPAWQFLGVLIQIAIDFDFDGPNARFRYANLTHKCTGYI